MRIYNYSEQTDGVEVPRRVYGTKRNETMNEK